VVESVDRGDMGAVPDPSWEERWAAWEPDQVQRYINSAAGLGPLSTVQVNRPGIRGGPLG
jgi:hypothetical protein